MNTSLDWIKQAMRDYAQTLPLSAQGPVLQCANFHVGAVERDLAELDRLKAKITTLQAEMERVGAPAQLEE